MVNVENSVYLSGKIKEGCTQKTSNNVQYLPSDALISCYGPDPSITPTSSVQYLVPLSPFDVGACYTDSNTKLIWITALFDQVAGTALVKLDGASHVLSDGGISPPCTTLVAKDNYFAVDVADGKIGCSDAPKQPQGLFFIYQFRSRSFIIL